MSRHQGWVVLAHRKSPTHGMPKVFIPSYTGLLRSAKAAEKAAEECREWMADDVERISIAEVREP